MAATTTLLGLVTPTQGTLSGTWGDTVNYGISDYLDIAIAGTLSFAGGGAITLVNTIGSASGNNIGATTGQYMVIRITGTQSVVKVITAPSYSKLYMVDHAGATSAVTFKASGQTGVSIAVGEKAFVYYNGTDYVKVASTVVSGTVGPASGGTGVANNAASTLTISGSFASNFTVSGAYTYTFPGQTSSLGYLNIPNSGAKTTSYTLVVGDVGKFIELGTSGTVVVPASIFAAGDAISIFNNTSASISCTCSAVTTVYKGGTDADISTFSVTTRGVATILFITATVAVVTGNLA